MNCSTEARQMLHSKFLSMLNLAILNFKFHLGNSGKGYGKIWGKEENTNQNVVFLKIQFFI